MNSPVKIFIVYARADAAYKDELIKALSPLKNQGWVESWHDGNIHPGQIWDEEIQQNLNAADVIVPLISNDFFASEYIQQVEIRHAFERHKQGKCAIIPVIVRACIWKSDNRLARLQVLPADGKPIGSWANMDEAYTSVVVGIRNLIDSQPEPVLTIFSQGNGEVQAYQPPFWKRYGLLLLVAGVLIAAFTMYQVGFTTKPKQTPPTTNIVQEDEKLFLAVKSPANIPKINGFLAKYPQSTHAPEARQLLEKLQSDFNFHLGSANALYRANEIDKAFEAFKIARDINPDAPEISALLNKLNHKKPIFK